MKVIHALHCLPIEISTLYISDYLIPFSGGGGGGSSGGGGSGGGGGGGGGGGTGSGGGGGGAGSDSDDTSENSTAGGCTPLTTSETVLSSRSPRPSKYNFYVELGKIISLGSKYLYNYC